MCVHSEETATSLTCVLSKLVHRLQVDDVRRELGIHLPQNNSTSGIPLQYVLNMVANRCTVGPPASVFVQPFPDHHPGQVLRGVAQPIDGHQQTWSWTCHLLWGVCCASAAGFVPGYNTTATVSVNWHCLTYFPHRRQTKSSNRQIVLSVLNYLMMLSSEQLCWSHRLQVLLDRQKATSVLSCLVAFEVADVDNDDYEICSSSSSSISPPRPTTAAQLLNRRHAV